MTKEELIDKVIHLNKEGKKDKEKYKEFIDLLPFEVLAREKSDILHSEKSEAYYRLKQYSESKNEAEKALSLNPNNAKANHYLGNYYYSFEKDYTIAEEYYKKAIVIDPTFVDPYNALGNIYNKQKNYTKAEEFYKKAIDIDSTFVHPYNGLGNLFSDQKDYTNAEVYYKKAIEIDPTYSHAYNGLGNIFYDRKDNTNAEVYYKKAIEIDQTLDAPYFNLGLLYNFNVKPHKLQKAKENFEKYTKLTKISPNEFTERAIIYVKEIEDILNSSELDKIIEFKDKIKNLLKFNDGEISHFTSLSTVKAIVIDSSKFRLSEATFLNDSSEGKTLFDYLNYCLESDINNNHEYTFAKKPFIGSFVHASKHNDLALWRLYGKEGSEEGKGCSITLDSRVFLQEIKENASDATKQNFDNEFQFYKVAYWDNNDGFLVDNKTNTKLKKAMQELKESISTFKSKKDRTPEEELNVQEVLNEIAYLFKNKEYQYENEIRLVIKDPFGYKKHLNFDTDKLSTKVYIELCPIQKCISSISIGPKTSNKDDWAAYFHYYFEQEKHDKVSIKISTLPYK